MSRVASLQQAGGASAVKFLEVTRIRSKRPEILICIFEGEDEKYYGCRLNTILGHNHWLGVNTGGRKIVLEVRTLITEHPVYNTTNFCCFIDQDYDTWTTNDDPQRVYVTPCYSVENLYANETCLMHILAAEFGVTEFNEYSSEHTAIISSFQKSFGDFLDCATQFNIWAKSRAIMERDKKPPIRIFLNDVSAENLADISMNGCTIKYDKNNISSLFKKNQQSDLCVDSVNEASTLLETSNKTQSFRGKQQLEFLGIFLSLLKADATSSKGTFFKNKIKIKLSLEKTDLLSELSQYAVTPTCLTSFLKNF